MDTRRTIFCETTFFQERRLNKSPRHIFTEEFLSKSDIFVESKTELIKLVGDAIDSSLFKLLKQNMNGGNFICEMKDFPKPEAYTAVAKNNLNAIFLVSEEERQQCRSISANSGVMMMDADDLIENESSLNKSRGKAIPEQATNWVWLCDYNKDYPQLNVCNAMIIVDPYILQDRPNGRITFREKIKNNIFPILRQLLPQTLADGIDFQIDMFVDDDNGWNDKEWDDRYDLICDTIESMNPELNYSLSIFATKDFHDRIIITNNVSIESGEGFDLFPMNPGYPMNPTRVSINYPFVQTHDESLDDHIIQVLKTAKRAIPKSRKKNKSFEAKSGRLNRIIKYYVRHQ